MDGVQYRFDPAQVFLLRRAITVLRECFEGVADVRDLVICALSAAIGYITLQPEGSPVLLLLLAVLWGCVSGRAAAFAVGFAFCVGSASTVPVAVLNFFPDLARGWAISVLLVYASCGATVFAVCWVRPERSVVLRLLAGVIVLVVLAVPPMGAVFWGHPVLASGELFPGMGLAGVAVTTVLWALLSALRFSRPTSTASSQPLVLQSRSGLSDLVAWLIAVSVVSCVVHLQDELVDKPGTASQPSLNTFGANFNLGYTTINQVAQYAYLSGVVVPTIKAMKVPAGAVVLLPESVAGVNTAARLAWWRSELKDFFEQGGTLIAGEFDVDGKGIAVISSTGYRYFSARQSTPFSEWTPTSQYPAFGAWSNVATVKNGKRYALINCYEALTVWPLVLDLIGRPDAILFASNQFWATGTRAPGAMAGAMDAWAKISGLPLISAINR